MGCPEDVVEAIRKLLAEGKDPVTVGIEIATFSPPAECLDLSFIESLKKREAGGEREAVIDVGDCRTRFCDPTTLRIPLYSVGEALSVALLASGKGPEALYRLATGLARALEEDPSALKLLWAPPRPGEAGPLLDEIFDSLPPGPARELVCRALGEEAFWRVYALGGRVEQRGRDTIAARVHAIVEEKCRGGK